MKSLLGMFGFLSLAIFLAFTTPEGPGLEVGDKAADFKLQNAIDDSWVSLADYDEAKGFIVIFTCNTCPYAVMYEDRINELHEKFAPKGYPVVAINPNDPEVKAGDSYEAMKVRAEDKNFEFAYLFDSKQEVFPAFGATRTPHVYLLDKELTVHYIGAIDDNAQDAEAATKHYVAKAIKAVDNGTTPDPTFTKAVGCSIKVKS